jgi:hypothetical protein
MTEQRRGRRAPRDAARWSRAEPARTAEPAAEPGRRRGPAEPRTSKPVASPRRGRDRHARTAGRRPDPRAPIPDSALPPRDRGPVRALVRDVVDARRGVVVAFPFAFGGVLIAALGPASSLQRWLLLGCSVLLVVTLVDAVLLGVSATRRARARFPDADVPGWATGFYAFMRAHRMRNLRLPPPRVDPGERV